MHNALKILTISIGNSFVLYEISQNKGEILCPMLFLAVFSAIGGNDSDKSFPPLLCISGAGFTLFCSNAAEQVITLIFPQLVFWVYFVVISLSFCLTGVVLVNAIGGKFNIIFLILFGIGIGLTALTLLLPKWTGYTLPWTLTDFPRMILYSIVFFFQILVTQNSGKKISSSPEKGEQRFLAPEEGD